MLIFETVLDYRPELAIKKFASVRPPGIYKQDYLQDFFNNFGDAEGVPAAPPQPTWYFGKSEPARFLFLFRYCNGILLIAGNP